MASRMDGLEDQMKAGFQDLSKRVGRLEQEMAQIKQEIAQVKQAVFEIDRKLETHEQTHAR